MTNEQRGAIVSDEDVIARVKAGRARKDQVKIEELEAQLKSKRIECYAYGVGNAVLLAICIALVVLNFAHPGVGR